MDLKSNSEKLIAIKDKLYRMALTLLQNKEDASDAVQEIYLMVYSNKKIHLAKNVEAYVMQSLKNKCFDILRSRKPELEINDSLHAIKDEITPYQPVSFNSLKDLVMKLMGTLPEQQRMIMHLRDIEHMTYEEISEISGLTINNIRVNLSRARKNIRSGYQKIKDYEER